MSKAIKIKQPALPAITFSKVSPPEIGKSTSKVSVSSVPKKKPVKKTPKTKEPGALVPVTNHWGYTFAEDKSGKQYLVMLEGPTVPQDILDELELSSDQRKKDDEAAHDSQEEEFEDFPQNIEQSEIPVTLVSSGSLKTKTKLIKSNDAGRGDSKVKTKKKTKRKQSKFQDKVRNQIDSAGDASFTVHTRSCSSDASSSVHASSCSSCSSRTCQSDQGVPKWMDDAIADFIRSNIKSPRLERECALRSCTEWLRDYNRKYKSLDRISSSSSVGDEFSETENDLENGFFPAFTEIGEGDNKMRIRYYPDFSDFYGEIPTRERRPPTRHYVDEGDRSQSYDFLHDDCLSDDDNDDDTNESPKSTVPSFAKFDNPKLKKALAKLNRLERARTLRDYHVPKHTPLHCCGKGGPPPEGRKAATTNKNGPPLGPFYICPINHISGLVLRRPKIRARKRGKRFDPGRRPHFLPFFRDFLRWKEGKDCCSCDKWKGRLGVGNHHDTDNYHQNYLNLVTYNKEAQIPCRSDRCDRCRFLATRSESSTNCSAKPKMINSVKKGPVIPARRPLLYKAPPSRQQPEVVIKAAAGTLSSKAKVTTKKILNSTASTPTPTRPTTPTAPSKSNDKNKPDGK